MRKETSLWCFKKHIVLVISIFLLFKLMSNPVLFMILKTTGKAIGNSKAASIGIIGGADGPTAIFLTSKSNDLLWGFKNILLLIGLLALYKPIQIVIGKYRKT